MIDKLIDAIIAKGNPTVMGLDTCIDYLPDKGADIASFQEAADRIIEFNKSLVDAAYDIIPAVKIQVAYYEMYGVEGMRAFHETAEYARAKGMIVMADCKRNDIGATAGAYSKAYLGETRIGDHMDSAYYADFLTVTPYLGVDGVEPFIKDCKEHDKGIFVLVKTSNPSSGQLQDMTVADGRKVYEVVGDYVAQWGEDSIGKYGYSDVGAVVGATYPEQGAVLRERLSSVFFLIPGYGAQGATGKDLAGSFDKNGLGGIVNASRSLMCAYRREEYAGLTPAEAMRKEAIRMREDIVGSLKNCGKWSF